MMGGDVKKKKNRRCFGEQMHTRAASNSERIPDKKKKKTKNERETCKLCSLTNRKKKVCGRV